MVVTGTPGWLEKTSLVAAFGFAFFLCNGIAPAQIAMGVGIAAWLPRVWRSPREVFSGGALEGSLLVLALVTALSSAAGVAPAVSFGAEGFVKTVGLMTVYFWIRDLVRAARPEARGDLLWVFVLGAGLQGLVGIGEFGLARLGFLHHERISGTLGMSLSMAELLSVGLLAATALASIDGPMEPAAGTSQRPNLLTPFVRLISSVTCAALAGISTVLTFARGAWAGAVAGLLVVVAAAPIRIRRLLAGGLVLGLLAVIFAASFAGGPFRIGERVGSIPRFLRACVWTWTDSPEAPMALQALDESAAERVRMWRSGARIVRDHPLGIGVHTLERVYPSYRLPDSIHVNEGHLHNNLVQITVDRGWLGLLAFLAVFVTFGIRVGRHWRLSSGRGDPVTRGAAASVLAIFVAGLSEYDFGDSKVAMALWFLLALGANRDAA